MVNLEIKFFLEFQNSQQNSNENVMEGYIAYITINHDFSML